jgi:hypothetical protein
VEGVEMIESDDDYDRRVEAELRRRGIADAHLQRWCAWRNDGSFVLSVHSDREFSPDQLRQAVGAGVGLFIDTTVSRFDFAVIEPVITSLTSLRFTGVAKNISGWDVLGHATALEHLDFGGVVVPARARFELMPKLAFLNVWGSADALLAAAPNLRGLGLHASGTPARVVTPVSDLLISGRRVHDLSFLQAPESLRSIRVVSAAEFDAAAFAACPELTTIEFLMCRRIINIGALIGRRLDRLALIDVKEVDDLGASINATDLYLDPDPMQERSEFAPFTVREIGSTWTVWMEDAGALTDYASRRHEEPSFYALSDAIHGAVASNAPELLDAIVFDPEAGAFAAVAPTRETAERVAALGLETLRPIR